MTYGIFMNSTHSAYLINQKEHNSSSYDHDNQIDADSCSVTSFLESFHVEVEGCFATPTSDSSLNKTTYDLVVSDAHDFISHNSSFNNMSGMKGLVHHSSLYQTSIYSILHDRDGYLKFHDRIAEWLERSYHERFPGNVRNLIDIFSCANLKGKMNPSFFTCHYEGYQPWLLIHNVDFHPGLNKLQWLHWSYHIT